MTLGQSLITVLFFALLTLMFLNAISLLIKADHELMAVNAYKTATDLGQSLMAEILRRKFDELQSGAIQYDYNAFTSPTSLGPDGAGESITFPDKFPYKSIEKYNDVDDYNGYRRLTDSTNGLAPFRDSVIVYYVQMTNPPAKYNGKWWTKRIEVWVTQDDYLSEVNPTTGVRTSKWIKLYSIVGHFRKA